MLGLKIAVTGAVVMFLTAAAMHAIGKKMPSPLIAIPMLAVIFGSMAAIVMVLKAVFHF